MPSIPTVSASEALTENETPRWNDKNPSQTNSDSNSDSYLPAAQPPEDCFHGIVEFEEEDTEEEEEPEEPDGNDVLVLKPYVKFNERFPSDLSWYDIETSDIETSS